MLSDFNITIVGLGLIGGSYAKALRRNNPKNLWAIDKDQHTIKKAMDLNVIDECESIKEALSKTHILIMCLYAQDNIKFIRENLTHLKEDILITDVCGVKGHMVQRINNIIGNSMEFIGGHPMAGREFNGFDYSHENLFMNCNYIITTIPDNTDKNIYKIRKIAELIGSNNIIMTSPKRHDELVAYTSHLSHVIANAFVNNTNEEANDFIGGSFKDITRVAYLNPYLWSKILINNKENVLKEIDKFEENIKIIKEALKEEDMDILCSQLESGRIKRKEINLKCSH
ncbi:MAG: prephenate dehydrogenase [Anaeromicrobium sp.]|uniref:prephenate dehydrogenase n=1 Tax=Anaeromicrobium sp. TaxID=1929132 RepID=UPI0025E96A92|nr:prephenate dehydrogenase [Anaeromicrobium sp.]MCT4595365.1 prephenate dehydrogenase [Anaeromicrobium sp.]